MSPGEFFSAVYSKAIELGANDVQARLAAAQASEETGFGKHMVGNNAFGIKAGTTYTGPAVTASTEEEYNGNTVRENARFRAYDDFTESVKDYLGVIQKSFPDAWSAETFSDAVEGLNTGVHGKYATRAAYGNNIKSIDGKYGGFQFAADPENVPTPYSPDDLTNNSLMAAFSPTTPSEDDPFSAVLGGQQPSVNQWDAMAAADPVKSPMGSVQATGLLGPSTELAAQARANPMMSLEAQGLLGGVPGLEAGATVSGLPQVASVSDRMGIAEPGFDMGRFDAVSPTVTEMDASRFSTPAKTSRIGTSLPGLNDMARMDPLTGAIDPSTNTQSFMDQPSNLGSFPDAMAAQRGAPTGLLSADMQTVQGNVERQLQNPSSLAPMVAPQTAMMSVPATAGLLGVPGLEAQATVPALTAQAPAVDQTTTGSVTPGLLSPTSIAAANVPISSTMTPNRILPSQPVQQNAFVDSFPSAVANNTIEPATVNDVVAAPTLETMQVSEQPAIASQMATVEGPATTPAVEQQTQQTQQTTTTTPSNTVAARTTPQNKSMLSGLLSKETAIGGLFGSMALGPAGGILGALAGRQIANNGGLGGLLGSSAFSAPTDQIAGGVSNISGIYGGAFSPGTFAVANNGATITAQPGGYATYTNRFGVSETVGPDGKISANFGGLFDSDAEQDAEASY